MEKQDWPAETTPGDATKVHRLAVFVVFSTRYF